MHPILVCCSKKNLATLAMDRALIKETDLVEKITTFKINKIFSTPGHFATFCSVEINDAFPISAASVRQTRAKKQLKLAHFENCKSPSPSSLSHILILFLLRPPLLPPSPSSTLGISKQSGKLKMPC
jgi:hypothetical protein